MKMAESSPEHIRFCLDESDFTKNGVYKSELYNFDDLIVPEIGKFEQLMFPESLSVGGDFTSNTEKIVIKGDLIVGGNVTSKQMFIGNDFFCNGRVVCSTLFVDERTQIGESLICDLFSGIGFAKIRRIVASNYFYFGSHLLTEEATIREYELSNKLPYIAIDGDLNGCDLIHGNEKNPQRFIFYFTSEGVIALNNKNGEFDFVENVKGIDQATLKYVKKIWKEKS